MGERRIAVSGYGHRNPKKANDWSILYLTDDGNVDGDQDRGEKARSRMAKNVMMETGGRSAFKVGGERTVSEIATNGMRL